MSPLRDSPVRKSGGFKLQVAGAQEVEFFGSNMSALTGNDGSEGAVGNAERENGKADNGRHVLNDC